MKPGHSHQPQLGQMLLAKGVLSEDQLRIALLEQAKLGQPLGKTLVSLGFISEDILRDALSETLGRPGIELSAVIVDPLALRLVPATIARRHHILPIDFNNEQRRLTVATADATDLIALDQIRGLAGGTIEIEAMIAGEADIDRALDKAYGHELSIEGILHEMETGEQEIQARHPSAKQYSQPVVRLVEAILIDAVKRDASDIHFEPEPGFLRIRYRIDGMLRQVRSLHASYWPAIAVRIKVLSAMDIAETRAPQDGRITLGMRGRQIDFRISSQPTIHGENIVLRVLDRKKGLVPLKDLGFTTSHRDQLERMIARPEGIILITGPTGSGKTTTLYSLLADVNSGGVNIMTLEDPVEYPMPMVRQTSVSESCKLDFANGIRSMMRQDPDIILVGEIRDAETAELAFRAAMTGHQVYSTLHTNSAIGAIPRLLDIGIPPDIMAGNIIGIVAQRLVRRLCPHCKLAYRADDHESKILGGRSDTPLPAIYRAAGCQHCDFQGYRGRFAIMETLRMNADLDELVARRSTSQTIRRLAEQQGFVSLADDGLRRVLDGSTSLAELARVIDLTDRL